MGKRIALVALALVVLTLTGLSIAFIYNPNGKDDGDELFSELPSKTEKFEIIKRAIEKGETTDICNVEREHYIHPEFYPTWEQGRKIFYDDHDWSRWGVHGYGAYPADVGMGVTNLKKGESIDFCTLFKTSYGIETFQGIKMILDDSEYFDVEIINQEFPEYTNHFIMYPTFPKFHKDWVRKLHIRVTAKQDIPLGEYIIGLNVAAPNDDFNNKMVWEILMSDTKRDETYVKSCVEEISKVDKTSTIDSECEDFMVQREKKYVKGGGWQIGRDMFAITLEVV